MHTAQSTDIPFAAGLDTSFNFKTPEIDFRAQSDPKFVTCGADCFYQKANETISNEYGYIFKKYQFLNDYSISGPQYDVKRRQLLGAFCPPTESLDSCVLRWNQVHQFWSWKVRGALGKNEQAQANLMSSGCPLNDPKCDPTTHPITFVAQTGEDYTNKSLQMTYVPTANELADFTKHWLQLNEVSDEVPTETWERTLTQNLMPNPDDFIQFQQVLRDPNNPQFGQIEIPVLDTKGHLLIDQQAYKKACQQYLKNFGVSCKDFPSSSLNPSSILANTTQNFSKTAPNQNQSKTLIKDFANNPTAAAQNQSLALYNANRNDYANDINNLFPAGPASVTPVDSHGNTQIHTEKYSAPDPGASANMSYSSAYQASQIDTQPDPTFQLDVSSAQAQIAQAARQLNQVQDTGE